MNTMSDRLAKWEPSVRLCIALATLVVVTSVVLLSVHTVYTPLEVDGAWYAYPGYSLAQGGDPGENFAPVPNLDNLDGLTVRFNFDTRDLRTYPIALWFKAFGTSIWIAKAYSLFELLTLVLAIYFILRQGKRANLGAMLAGLLVLSDISTLALGSTDLRPDLSVATFTVLLFGTTVMQRDGFSWQRCLISVLLAGILVFVHMSSAIAFSVVGGAMLADFLINRREFTSARTVSYVGVLSTGAIGLVFFRPFRDLLVPSQFDASHLYFPSALGGFDLTWTLNKEGIRWYGYFFDSNVAILAAIAIIAVYATTVICKGTAPRNGSTIPIVAGLLCGVIVLAIINPHTASSHALSVVVFTFVLAAQLLSEIGVDQRRWLVPSLVVILVTASIAKLALGTRIYLQHESANISNGILSERLSAEARSTDARLIIGPAKLWAYLDSGDPILILDRRTGELDVFESLIDNIDLIVVDQEYRSFDFVNLFMDAFPHVSLNARSVIGDPGSSRRLEILEVSSSGDE